MMLFILLITIGQIFYSDSIETTSPISLILDGFTLESWNKQFIWNKTRLVIVQHLNRLCKHDNQCDAEYGIENIHLLDVLQFDLSSIRMRITVDEPILNNTEHPSIYNYTTLLTSALFQAKIDIEHWHDNQLVNTITYSSTHSHQISFVSRTSRLLSVLLGICIVAIVFSLTIYCFQKIRQHQYSKLFQTRRIRQQVHDDLLDDAQSISVLHS